MTDQTKLLNMVHELDEDTAGQERLDQLLTYTAVWRYRPHINVDHFFRQFQLQVESHRDMDNTYPVIRLFKKEVHGCTFANVQLTHAASRCIVWFSMSINFVYSLRQLADFFGDVKSFLLISLVM